MPQPENDARVVQECLGGKPEAFEALLDRYKNQAFSFILRFVQNPSDAEDLAQETFVKAFRSLPAYDSSRPFLTWLLRIAHNGAVDFLRARKPQALSLDDAEGPIDVEDASQALDSELESASERALIEKLLGALPPLYREVLVLRHQQQLDYRQIAEILQLPEGTVKIRLFRARDMMKKKLEAFGYGG